MGGPNLSYKLVFILLALIEIRFLSTPPERGDVVLGRPQLKKADAAASTFSGCLLGGVFSEPGGF